MVGQVRGDQPVLACSTLVVLSWAFTSTVGHMRVAEEPGLVLDGGTKCTRVGVLLGLSSFDVYLGHLSLSLCPLIALRLCRPDRT